MNATALPAPDEPQQPEQGVALALSGGGYRAMIFHLGALIRLNEAGLLGRLSRISSVSGGSLTSAALGMSWSQLDFGPDGVARNLAVVTEAVQRMADVTVDVGAIIGGILLPGAIGEKVAAKYDRVLFKGKTLQDLPADGAGPRFVINATNVQSGVLWRFSRPYMGDYRVGFVMNPTLPLATAVAASSAFPPILSPLPVAIEQPFTDRRGGDLQTAAYRDTVYLSDGGVYDNLGLETVEKHYTTLLVSDAGQKMRPEEAPASDWARHAVRVLDLVDNQVRSLRQRHLIDGFLRKDRTGCYWSARARFADYGAPSDPLGCAGWDTSKLSAIPTRLQAMPRDLQARLINWGYAICDASLRRFFAADAKKLYAIEIAEPRGLPASTGT